MSLFDNPAHWRTRAADIRRAANAALDPVYQAKLEKLAASYDLLAVRAAARTALADATALAAIGTR
jgi:hypothetical protein